MGAVECIVVNMIGILATAVVMGIIFAGFDLLHDIVDDARVNAIRNDIALKNE